MAVQGERMVEMGGRFLLGEIGEKDDKEDVFLGLDF